MAGMAYEEDDEMKVVDRVMRMSDGMDTATGSTTSAFSEPVRPIPPLPIGTKFRVGDMVECIERSDLPPNAGGCGWQKGKQFKIGKITFDARHPVYWPNSGDGVYETHLKLMDLPNTKEISETKFKVGDAVIARKGGRFAHQVCCGVQIIAKVNAHPNYKYETNKGMSYDDDDLEKMSEIKDPWFGKAVRFRTYSGHSDWENHRGQTAIISEKLDPAHNGFEFRVYWADGSESCVNKSNIMFADELAKLKWVKINSPTFQKKLKEGLIVELQSNYVIGQIGEVDKTKFYIWQNVSSGSRGTKDIKGFIFSYVVHLSDINNIRILGKRESTAWLKDNYLTELHIGDIVSCKPNCGNYFSGKGQIVLIDSKYFYLSVPRTSGGGVRLSNGRNAWTIPITYRPSLLAHGNKPLTIKIDESIRLFNEKDEVYIKDEKVVGTIYAVGYDNGMPYYYIQKYPHKKQVVRSYTEIEYATNEIKIEVCYQCLMRRLTRDKPGTDKENKLIRAGCLVEVRNLKECEENSLIIGNKYIILNGDYDSETSDRCLTCADGLFKMHVEYRYRLKFLEDLKKKKEYKLRISKLAVNSMENFKYEKSPILLFGRNKKGIVDVVFMATDGSGCDNLATMPRKSLAAALRNIMLTNREFAGYGVLYPNKSGLAFFSDLGQRFILRDANIDRFYVSVVSGRGIFPYKLVDVNGRMNLMPVKLEIVK